MPAALAAPQVPGPNGEAAGVTWYGLPYRVRYGGWCDLEVAGLPMPHPSLINVFIRRGLEESARARLTRLHEQGHLETLPLALAYGLFGLALGRSRSPRAGWFLWLLGLEAAWELLTESYVVSRNPGAYRQAYRGTPNRWILAFWPLAALGALLPALRRGGRARRGFGKPRSLMHPAPPRTYAPRSATTST